MIEIFIGSAGRRFGIERREFSYTAYIPERRNGKDRRDRFDRRSRFDRRNIKRSIGERRNG